ncbi:Autophagy protein Atg8 ubiquitin like [Novymonas esmeraldas]|uniref:Autophagy-related protein n=1 Tax=Novymonas esmeraldas TaxID=1808958 RepID=A0AAW0EZV5_9TRYP
MSAYQTSNAVEVRRAECAHLQAKYPGHVAMVVEAAAAKSAKPHFLALPRDATVAELEAAVRTTIELTTRKLGILVCGCSPAPSTMLGDLYGLCRHDDGFLYVAYRGESILGAQQIPCMGSTDQYLQGVINNPDIIGSLS